VLSGIGYGWRQLSRRQQQNVKRHLNEAVKMAGDAYESMRKPEEAPAGGGKPGKPTVPPPVPPGRAKPAPGAPTVASAQQQQQQQQQQPLPQRSMSPMIPPPEPTPRPSEPLLPAPTPPAPTPNPSPAPATPSEAPAGATAETPLGDDADADDDSTEEPAPPRDTPGARLEEQTPLGSAAAAGPTARDAVRLLTTGRTDQGIQVLYAVRKRSPRNAEVALLLGHAYFRKGWRTDGLREYDTAIKLSPALRRNALLIRNTVLSLQYAQTYRLARAVIRVRIGAPAISDVRKLARITKSRAMRIRATRLAWQLVRAARRR
jgi:hypothetical protein